MPNVQITSDHVATVASLRKTMTRDQIQAALHEADIDDFHDAEAATCPTLPEFDVATWDALRTHITDGAGHMDLQRELLAAHVALHAGDQRAFWLGLVAIYKLGLMRVPKAAIDAALQEMEAPVSSSGDEVVQQRAL